MIDALIRFSLLHRPLIVVFSLLISGLGLWVGNQLPIDVFPDLNRPTVSIMTESHGLAPEEVETLVTFPLEVTMNGMPGLTRMRSSSGVGLSMIWLEFEWGTDIYLNRQLVSERLILAKDRLPQNVQPIMGPITSIMGEIQLIGITSSDPQVSDLKLREIADWVIRPRLLAIPGIAQAVPMGGGVKQYQILLDSKKLKQKNLSLEDITDHLRHISENTTGGFIEKDDKELLIRILGRIESEEDIYNAYVGSFQGRAVTVRDIATVKVGHRVKRGDASINGEAGVIISIKKQPGTSSLKLTKNVEEALEQISATLPNSIKINPHLFKQATFIENAIDNVKEAVRDGAILVSIILFIFLLSLRTTFITLTAIPTSIAITLIVFYLFGLEINTMTLGGLAIAIGLLVDDAIVDVENVFRRIQENAKKSQPEPLIKVIFLASKEIRNSIIFATAIVIIAFLPLFFLAGLEGRFFIPMGISFITSLLASLLVSLTLTPVLCSLFLKSTNEEKQTKESIVVKKLKAWDEKALHIFFKRPLLILVPTVLLFLFSLLLASRFSSEFLPEFDEGTALASVLLPPGISLQESNEVGNKIEKELLKIPEIKSVSRRTGRAELDEHAQGVNASEIDLDFHPKGRNRSEVLSEIRNLIEQNAPQASVNLGQPISHRLDHMLSGVNAQIALKIFGDDRSTLQRLATQVLDELKTVEGVVDEFVEDQTSIPQIKSYLIREDANKYDINPGKVANMLELALQGEVPTQVIEGNQLTDIFVRLDEKSRNSLEAIQETLVRVMPDGTPVYLKDLADIFESSGPNLINRENMQRRIVVQANIHDRALSDVISDIKKKIQENVKMPERYFLSYEGQFENQQQATQTILLLSLFSFLGILFLLYSHFHSYTLSLQVLINIPLAFIGSVIALNFSGGVISLASLVAFITLCGIASRNGILMLSHYRHLMIEEGENFNLEMIVRGSLERLVPVLMTALSAILALIPLLLSKGEPGKEILYPVAVVIVGGLISSTLLDIWVTPIIFYLFGKKSIAKSIAKELKRKEI